MAEWTREDTAKEVEQRGCRADYERAGITSDRLAAIDDAVLKLGEAHLKDQAERSKPKPNIPLLREVRETAVNVRKLRGDYPADNLNVNVTDRLAERLQQARKRTKGTDEQQ